MTNKRILGSLRIFQSVQADLDMVNDWQNNAYIYKKTDPYQLEDDAFPITVSLINDYANQKQLELLDELSAILTRSDSQEVLEKMKEIIRTK